MNALPKVAIFVSSCFSIQQMKSSCPGQELEQLHYDLSCRKTLGLLPLLLQSTPLHHDPVTLSLVHQLD
jgi:hypothetical protein